MFHHQFQYIRDRYFFILREKSGLHCLVIQSLWRLVRYHLGTVAFGSFIIALIQFIRMIMHYIEKKLKKNGGDNKVIEMCLKVTIQFRFEMTAQIPIIICNISFGNYFSVLRLSGMSMLPVVLREMHAIYKPKWIYSSFHSWLQLLFWMLQSL